MYRGKYEAVPQGKKQPETSTPPVQTGSVATEQPAEVPEARPALPQRRPPRRRTRKRTTRGTIIFYAIYALVIIASIIGIIIAMGALKDWLLDFEASQPDNRSQQIFTKHFSDPDWAALYEMAGIEDTKFEDATAYVSYMEELVGDHEITMVETSAGLSGGKKYVLRATLGEEEYFNFATYTLVDKKSEKDIISDWQLGQVQLFTWDPKAPQDMVFRRPLGYRFLIHPDSVVTVNGIVLDESYLLRTVATVAEGYLPQGVHGYRLAELHVDGLLTEPTIQITDAQGVPQEVTFDPALSMYVQTVERPQIQDEEYTTLLTAAKTYCQYMIGAVGAWDLRSCFDHEAPIYTTITTNTTWMQGYKSFDFGKETISGFYRYSDTLYSAKVTLALNVTRSDGSVKVYPLSSTFFLELQGESWKVIEMTNVDVQEETTQVRVTYMDGDTVLSSQMVDSESKKLTPPQITAPEGKVFKGWYLEAGRLETAEDGTILLPTGFTLEPMTVYALFGAEEG